MPVIALPELQQLAARALVRAGAGPEMAAATARALVYADARGLASHGVARVPQYATHLANGRADGTAVPEVVRARGGAVLVDARCGLAFPACALAVDAAIERAREFGVALRRGHQQPPLRRCRVSSRAGRRGGTGRAGAVELPGGDARGRWAPRAVRDQPGRRGVSACRRSSAVDRPVAVGGCARQADGRRQGRAAHSRRAGRSTPTAGRPPIRRRASSARCCRWEATRARCWRWSSSSW